MKRVLDKIPRPPGSVPARAQAWLLVGLTAIMTVIFVTFPGQVDGTSGPQQSAQGESMTGPASGVGVASAEGAADRIREEAVRNAERRMRAELGVREPRSDGLPHPPERVPAGGGTNPSPSPASSGALTAAEQIEREERVRRYRSLSAPPLVQTARSGRTGTSAVSGSLAETSSGGTLQQAAPSPGTSPPSDIERGAMAVSPAPPTPTPPSYVLREGEFLEAVLTNRLAGDFVGPVNAMVSADVYDRTRQRVLVPRGTRALGQAKPVQDWGQSRLAVTFHRLVLPDGSSRDLADGVGLNQVGETGLRDRVNRHYLSTLAASGAVGSLAGFSQVAGPSDTMASRLGSARISVGAGLSRATERILDRYLNRLPKVTIREGHRIRIYLTRDLTLPAYRIAGNQNRRNSR